MFSTDKQIGNFQRSGFNDRASSVIVGCGLWEVCEEVRFGGRCMVLRRGSYDSLSRMVGSGSGRDVATAGGAVVGAVVGANVGRDSGATTYDRDVQRCETTASGPPQYWDVTHNFRNWNTGCK